MDNETQKILEEQMAKLPSGIVDFISSSSWDTDLDEIGSLYNLSTEELSGFKREVTLVLAGLVHPDALRETLEQEVGIQGAVLEAIVVEVEDKIFAPVRPALIEFFEEEVTRDTQEGERPTQMPAFESVAGESAAPAPQKEWGRMPDVAPDNLPIAEEPFLPPLQSKINPGETEPVHPFEEKMKRVFTAGQQSMGDLTLEPAPDFSTPPTTNTSNLTPAPVPVPPIPPPYHADKYREPIE